MKNSAALLCLVLMSMAFLFSWFKYEEASVRYGKGQAFENLIVYDAGERQMAFETMSSGKDQAVFLVDPYCNYCDYQIKHLIKNYSSFKQLDFIFLVIADNRNFKLFKEKYKGGELEQFHFFRIAFSDAETHFPTHITPSLFYFNEKGNLIHTAQGFVKKDYLLQFYKIR